MTQSRTTCSLLASVCAALAVVSCSGGGDQILFVDDLPNAPASLGSARVALNVADESIDTVTAILSGTHGFDTQTETIDVSGRDEVVSIFFGSLPVEPDYQVELVAGDCAGSASFRVKGYVTSVVDVTLTCDTPVVETGSVQVIGTFADGDDQGRACDLVASIVASPSRQGPSMPTPAIALALHENVAPIEIVWTWSSPNGASGEVYGYANDSDASVSFDCRGPGTIYVDAEVTGAGDGDACTERARAIIECEG